MQMEIPAAHGEAIAERGKLMQAVFAQFRLLQIEEKRHIDAVLKTLGHNPDDYAQYDLKQDGSRYFLDLQAKQQAAEAGAPPPAAKPNGAAALAKQL